MKRLKPDESEAEVPASLAMVGSLPALGIVAAAMGWSRLWLQPIVRQRSWGADCPCHGRYVPRYFTGLWIHFTVSDRFAPEELKTTKMMQRRKITLLFTPNGYAPPIAVEFGRKTLYSSERPSLG